MGEHGGGQGRTNQAQVNAQIEADARAYARNQARLRLAHMAAGPPPVPVSERTPTRPRIVPGPPGLAPPGTPPTPVGTRMIGTGHVGSNYNRGAPTYGGPGRNQVNEFVQIAARYKRTGDPTELQHFLRDTGYDIAIDGQWGPQTENAANAFIRDAYTPQRAADYMSYPQTMQNEHALAPRDRSYRAAVMAQVHKEQAAIGRARTASLRPMGGGPFSNRELLQWVPWPIYGPGPDTPTQQPSPQALHAYRSWIDPQIARLMAAWPGQGDKAWWERLIRNDAVQPGSVDATLEQLGWTPEDAQQVQKMMVENQGGFLANMAKTQLAGLGATLGPTHIIGAALAGHAPSLRGIASDVLTTAMLAGPDEFMAPLRAVGRVAGESAAEFNALRDVGVQVMRAGEGGGYAVFDRGVEQARFKSITQATSYARRYARAAGQEGITSAIVRAVRRGTASAVQAGRDEKAIRQAARVIERLGPEDVGRKQLTEDARAYNKAKPTLHRIAERQAFMRMLQRAPEFTAADVQHAMLIGDLTAIRLADREGTTVAEAWRNLVSDSEFVDQVMHSAQAPRPISAEKPTPPEAAPPAAPPAAPREFAPPGQPGLKAYTTEGGGVVSARGRVEPQPALAATSTADLEARYAQIEEQWQQFVDRYAGSRTGPTGTQTEQRIANTMRGPTENVAQAYRNEAEQRIIDVIEANPTDPATAKWRDLLAERDAINRELTLREGANPIFQEGQLHEAQNLAATPSTVDEAAARAHDFLPDAERLIAEHGGGGTELHPAIPPGFEDPQQLANLLGHLQGRAIEAAQYKEWFANSAKAFINYVGGDLGEARKLAALFAIYSPNEKVYTRGGWNNLVKAMRAYDEFTARIGGGRVTTPAMQGADKAAKAEAVMNGDFSWSGLKTNSFFRNFNAYIDAIEHGVTPEHALQDVLSTQDVWMKRVFPYLSRMREYTTPAGKRGIKAVTPGVTDAQYAFMHDATKAVGDSLGWNPAETQAAIWSHIKSEVEGHPGIDYAQGMAHDAAFWEANAPGASDEAKALFAGLDEALPPNVGPREAQGRLVRWLWENGRISSDERHLVERALGEPLFQEARLYGGRGGLHDVLGRAPTRDAPFFSAVENAIRALPEKIPIADFERAIRGVLEKPSELVSRADLKELGWERFIGDQRARIKKENEAWQAEVQRAKAEGRKPDESKKPNKLITQEDVHNWLKRHGPNDPKAKALDIAVHRQPKDAWDPGQLTKLLEGTPAEVPAGLTTEEYRELNLPMFIEHARNEGKKTVTRADALDWLEGMHTDLRENVRSVSPQEPSGFHEDPQQPGSSVTKYSEYTLPGGQEPDAKYHELTISIPSEQRAGRGDYTGGHFPERNVVVHVRFTERTVDGERTLFIEEIQSDWHQAGQKRGYKMPVTEHPDFRMRLDRLSRANADAEAFREKLARDYGPSSVWGDLNLMPASQSHQERWQTQRWIRQVEDFPGWRYEVREAPVEGARGYVDPGRQMIFSGPPDREKELWQPIAIDQHSVNPTRFPADGQAQRHADLLNNLQAMRSADRRDFGHTLMSLDQAEAERTHAESLMQALEQDAGRGVPDAPWKTTWRELGMKRMLRWAVDHGYDRVAWTTGKTQAERYDLANFFRRIEVEANQREANSSYYRELEHEWEAEKAHWERSGGPPDAPPEPDEADFTDAEGNLDEEAFGHALADWNEAEMQAWDSLEESFKENFDQEYFSQAEQGYRVRAWTHENQTGSPDAEHFPDDAYELEGTIGKDLADEFHRIGGGHHVFEGENIAMGENAASARAAVHNYDKMLPGFVNRYLKKHGVKSELRAIERTASSNPYVRGEWHVNDLGTRGFQPVVKYQGEGYWRAPWGNEGGIFDSRAEANNFIAQLQADQYHGATFHIARGPSDWEVRAEMPNGDIRIVGSQESVEEANRLKAEWEGGYRGMEALRPRQLEGHGEPVHSIDLTPEAKQFITEGQPLHQAAEHPAGQAVVNAATWIRPEEGNVMRFYRTANLSTGLHELAHALYARMSEAEKVALAEVGIHGQEDFARSWEDYFRHGVAPGSELQPAFDYIAQRLGEIYREGNVPGSKFNPAVGNALDRFFLRRSVADTGFAKTTGRWWFQAEQGEQQTEAPPEAPPEEKGPPTIEGMTPEQYMRTKIPGMKNVRGRIPGVRREAMREQAGRADVELMRSIGYEAFLNAKAAARGQLPTIEYHGLKGMDNEMLMHLIEGIRTHPRLQTWEKINAGDALVKAVEGTAPTKYEIKLFERIYGKPVAKGLAKLADSEWWKKWAKQIINIPRALQSAYDLSAPLRQGLVAMARHPIIGTKNFPGMARAALRKNFYTEGMKEIQTRDLYQAMVDAGVKFTDLDKGEGMTHTEEQFSSSIAEKIPGVGASARAYTYWLNRMRADVFEHVYQAAIDNAPELVSDEYFTESLAKVINAMTGRGSMPDAFERAAPILNATLFSPRLLAARLNYLNPRWYIGTRLGVLHPVARREMQKSAASLMTAAGSLLGLAVAAEHAYGKDKIRVVGDPRNADFGKIRVGNTRFDVMGGFLQPIRLASQLATGQIISSTTGRKMYLSGGFGATTPADIFLRFLRSKLSPPAAAIADLGWKRTYEDQPVTWKGELQQHVTPMLWQDVHDVYKHPYAGLPSAAAGAATYGIGGLGVGVQTYGPKPTSTAIRDKLSKESKQAGLPPPTKQMLKSAMVESQIRHVGAQKLKPMEKLDEMLKLYKQVVGKPYPYEVDRGTVEDVNQSAADVANDIRDAVPGGDYGAYHDRQQDITDWKNEQVPSG